MNSNLSGATGDITSVKNFSEPETGLSQLTDFGVRRDGQWLVRHIDLQIYEGEIVTVVGPNGSGKSTTMRGLAGLIEPDEGSYEIKVGTTVGYVPQQLSINPAMPLTVARMMAMGGRASGNEIAAALDNFQIAHLAEKDIHALSGGEYQRMALARALISKPRLLLLDEPTKGVDVNGQLDIYEHIQRYRDESGAGIVLISHDLHLVMAATNRVICLNGHVCCSGTPQSVVNDPDYLQLFDANARSKLAVYKHDHDHVHLADGRVQHADGSISAHHDDSAKKL